MDVLVYLYIIILFAISLIAWMVYLLISKGTRKKGIRKEIRQIFNAQDYGDSLKFEYRGYTMLATFRPDVKISIFHERQIEGVKPPRGMKLTPMFLIIKIRRGEEIKGKVDEAVDFLNSIPTQ